MTVTISHVTAEIDDVAVAHVGQGQRGDVDRDVDPLSATRRAGARARRPRRQQRAAQGHHQSEGQQGTAADGPGPAVKPNVHSFPLVVAPVRTERALI